MWLFPRSVSSKSHRSSKLSITYSLILWKRDSYPHRPSCLSRICCEYAANILWTNWFARNCREHDVNIRASQVLLWIVHGIFARKVKVCGVFAASLGNFLIFSGWSPQDFEEYWYSQSVRSRTFKFLDIHIVFTTGLWQILIFIMCLEKDFEISWYILLRNTFVGTYR